VLLLFLDLQRLLLVLLRLHLALQFLSHLVALGHNLFLIVLRFLVEFSEILLNNFVPLSLRHANSLTFSQSHDLLLHFTFLKGSV
jgi:hypothetical protein